MKSTYKKSLESLFTKGGTMKEDYIEISNKNKVVAKIGISELTQYNKYNIRNEVIGNSIYYKDIEIDGKDYIVVFNSNTKLSNIKKVVEDREFVYKVQKTQIKAIDGIKGLIKFIKDSSVPDSPFNSTTESRLQAVINQG